MIDKISPHNWKLFYFTAFLPNVFICRQIGQLYIRPIMLEKELPTYGRTIYFTSPELGATCSIIRKPFLSVCTATYSFYQTMHLACAVFNFLFSFLTLFLHPGSPPSTPCYSKSTPQFSQWTPNCLSEHWVID